MKIEQILVDGNGNSLQPSEIENLLKDILYKNALEAYKATIQESTVYFAALMPDSDELTIGDVFALIGGD